MHESWTAEARTILDRACASHGGLERYGRLRSVSLTPRHFGGRLPARKGLGRSFPLPPRVDIFPHDRCTVFVDYPDPGYDGVFDDGDVWIRRRASGEVVVDSPDHRKTYAGLGRFRRWDALDALDALGPLLWRHQALPFALAATELLGLRTTGGTRPLTVVDVLWSDELRRPGRRQSCYFDWAGRLQRVDCHGGGAAAWMSLAWFAGTYERVAGLAVAIDQRITPRVGPLGLGVTWLQMAFAGVTLVDAEPTHEA